ncbi:hypothetical protein Lal_00022960 [Lupinus albus]|nr:hypothetical protein Lal_00022960 [Lupinus albus]
MGSSSRSKRVRNTNPLDLSRLLKDDEQQKRFLNHYIERPLMTPKYGSLAAFEEQGCHFPSLIRAQGLHVFVEDKTPIELNVDFTIELETPFSIKEHRIDLTSLGKMQILVALDGSLRHKDHQVEDDAPMEAPAQHAPPAPQDLGNSPYYQSIIDELAG